MVASFIVWVVVATLLMITFVARIVSDRRHAAVKARIAHTHAPVISLGRERDEFFIPGDSYSMTADEKYDINYFA